MGCKAGGKGSSPFKLKKKIVEIRREERSGKATGMQSWSVFKKKKTKKNWGGTTEAPGGKGKRDSNQKKGKDEEKEGTTPTVQKLPRVQECCGLLGRHKQDKNLGKANGSTKAKTSFGNIQGKRGESPNTVTQTVGFFGPVYRN